MKKANRHTWFNLASYLVFSLIITVLILCLLGDRSDLLAFVCMLLLVVLCLTLVRLFSLEKKRRRYDMFFQWLENESMDLEHLPDEIREDVQKLQVICERRNSYQALQARMEFSALQNQINPHFLYNTLDAIRSQALSIRADEIADMTGRLSRFFRYSIKNRGDMVTISEEMRNIEDYFAIQRYRFEDRFSLDIHCADMEIMGCYIPKMTFQPLVENALYHGLEPKKGTGKITVLFQKGERTIRVVIRDNGIGMVEEQVRALNQKLNSKTPPVSQEQRGGIALYNVNKRLKLLFGEMYGLHITSSPGMGTDVEILLPVIHEEQRSQYSTGL